MRRFGTTGVLAVADTLVASSQFFSSSHVVSSGRVSHGLCPGYSWSLYGGDLDLQLAAHVFLFLSPECACYM